MVINLKKGWFCIMYNPNDKNPSDENTNMPQGNQNFTSVPGNTSNAWQSPSQQGPSSTQWNGSSYRSGPQPSYQQTAWNHTAPVPPAPSQKPKKARNHHRGRSVLKVVAICLVCLIISTGSIAGFAALVNNGYITLNGSNNGSPYTINKVVENANANTETTDGLTMQEIAKKTIPSVVCIQNYQISSNYGWVNQAATSSSDVSPTSEGSGIILSEDGYIITNALSLIHI